MEEYVGGMYMVYEISKMYGDWKQLIAVVQKFWDDMKKAGADTLEAFIQCIALDKYARKAWLYLMFEIWYGNVELMKELGLGWWPDLDHDDIKVKDTILRNILELDTSDHVGAMKVLELFTEGKCNECVK